MRAICPFACTIASMLWASMAVAQPVHPGKTGTELEALVRGSHSPTRSLSYLDARKAMFGRVDNTNGNVRLVYTGDTVPNPSGVILDPRDFNAEHVWPQSRFGSGAANQKKSDLHHLFPCYARVNAARGNNPFGEIGSGSGVKFWNGPTSLSGTPRSNIDSFSKSTTSRFEPRKDDKGDIARAIFYFRAIYGNTGIDQPFFNGQRAVLLRWHRDDPADATEKKRNARIAQVQGNSNPFIDDATLAGRMFGDSGGPPVPRKAAATAGAGGLANGDEIRVMTWNLRFFYDDDTSDNVSQLAKDMSADSPQAFAKRVQNVAGVIKDAGLPQIVALQEIENKLVVERLAKELNDKHGAKYKVGFVQGDDTFTEQDVAFLYEDRALEVGFARIPEAGFSNQTLFKVPSKHCVMTVTQRLAGGKSQRLVLVNCHLKAGGGSSDEAQRKKQARVVSGFVKKTLEADQSTGVIVLGDMNAGKSFQNTSAADGVGVLRGLETPDPLDDLVDLNGELSASARKTHVSNRELDRILLSGALLDDVGLVFSQVVVRKDLIDDDQSDHFPMIATFRYQTTPSP